MIKLFYLITTTMFILGINAEDIQEVYFAGGCFWCMEAPFEKLNGVQEVISGFSGGIKANPAYKEVASGKTKHRETIKVIYDADIIDYQTLLNVFWRQIDPTDPDGQFVDRGHQYSAAIFYRNNKQKQLAGASKKRLDVSGWFNKPVVTDIVPFATFYVAEDYHQDYYKEHTFRYRFYRGASGRDLFRKKIWGDELDSSSPIIKKHTDS